MSKLITKKRVIALHVVLALFFYMADPLPARVENDETRQLEKAKKEYTNGQYNLVKARCERAIGTLTERETYDPRTLGQCYILLGAVYEKEGNRLLAKENYIKARDEYDTRRVEGVNLDDLPIYREIMFTIPKPGDPPNGRKKFPWFLVIGGTVVVGVVIYLLASNTKKYRLTVNSVEGVEGVPVPGGVYKYSKGYTETYSYKASQGYKKPKVIIDGIPQNETGGKITMNQNRTITFEISRAEYQLILDRDEVLVPEGGTAAFGIRLSHNPWANVSVTVEHAGGDTGFKISGDGKLNFDQDDYSSFKYISLTSEEDDDIKAETAQFRIKCPNTAEKIVTAIEDDNDKDQTLNITITGRSNNEIVSGKRVIISAETTSKKGVSSVQFFVGDAATPVETVPQPPYRFRWNTETVPDGPYKIRAAVNDTAGQTADDQITLVVKNTLNRYRLDVSIGEGVSGTPLQSRECVAGETVVYQYKPKIGYDKLKVTLNEQSVPASDQFIINRDSTLKVWAEPTQYQLEVEIEDGISGKPDKSGTYPAQQTVNYEYHTDDNRKHLSVFLDDKSKPLQGDFIMNKNRKLVVKTYGIVFETDPAEGPIQVFEGTKKTVKVRLSTQPPTAIDAVVSLNEDEGDSGIRLVSGQTLSFGVSNWDDFQEIELLAPWDQDDKNNPTAKLQIDGGESISKKIIELARVEDFPPDITVRNPQNGQIFTRDVDIHATVADPGLKEFNLYIDNQFIKADDRGSLEYRWETFDHSLGDHEIRFEAKDAGNPIVTETVTVTLANEKPVIDSIGMEPSSTAAGGDIHITGNIYDYRKIASVRILMDGNEIWKWKETPAQTLPIDFTLPTSGLTPGEYTITVEAIDTDGSSSQSGNIILTVTQ